MTIGTNYYAVWVRPKLDWIPNWQVFRGTTVILHYAHIHEVATDMIAITLENQILETFFHIAPQI